MYETPQRAIAVHHAMRDLANIKSSSSAVELATQARPSSGM
ncbi:hypothetical protein [Psychromonas sp. MB-3u-54]|nr:hypothetical protein [Psychromonas sp. MB-3u-54]